MGFRRALGLGFGLGIGVGTIAVLAISGQRLYGAWQGHIAAEEWARAQATQHAGFQCDDPLRGVVRVIDWKPDGSRTNTGQLGYVVTGSVRNTCNFTIRVELEISLLAADGAVLGFSEIREFSSPSALGLVPPKGERPFNHRLMSNGTASSVSVVPRVSTGR
jgi:hypothetical protein